MEIIQYIFRFGKETIADIIILWLLKLGITMLIHNKDDIEFVTEFPCFLGHPVYSDLEKKGRENLRGNVRNEINKYPHSRL